MWFGVLLLSGVFVLGYVVFLRNMYPGMFRRSPYAYVPPKQIKTKTVLLFFHGNGHTQGEMDWFIQQIDGRLFTYAVEYPWFGNRKPCGFFPNQDTIVEDAVATVNLFKESDQIVLYGTSLGTAVVLQVATRLDRLDNVYIILENPLESVDRIVKLPLWLWKAPTQLPHQVPMLCLFSGADEFFNHSDFFAKHYEHAERVVLPGACHGHAASHPLVLPSVRAFLNKHVF